MVGQTTIRLNQKPANADLRDVLNDLKRETFLDLVCHHVGQIQSFNPVLQTAQVSINYTRTSFEPDDSGVVQAVQTSYPLLIDVPVVCLGGGQGALTFPIAKGDDCLVLFNDRDIDVWFSGSANSACATGRAHSISDGFALVGIRSAANSIVTYDGANVVMRYGANSSVSVGSSGTVIKFGSVTLTLNSGGLELDGATLTLKDTTNNTEVYASPSEAALVYGSNTKVAAQSSKVLIQNTSGTLGTVLGQLVSQLSSLVTAIEAITVTCAAPGSPSTVPLNLASFTPIASSLTTISSTLSGLLA